MTWRVIVESSIGVSHQKRGIVCQDYGSYKCFADVMIGAVADGAGSAKYSDEGAKLAVHTALKYLQEHYHELNWNSEKEASRLFSQTVQQVQRALQEKAHQKEYQLNDLACTLLLFLAMPDRLAAMQIGDGFIVVKPLEKSYQLLFRPEKGEFANETTFITSSTALHQMQVCLKLGKYPFICASTDGVERLAIRLSDYTPSPSFFQPFEEYLQDPKNRQECSNYLQEFLSSERLNSRTDDDKTLLVCLYDHHNIPSIPPSLDRRELPPGQISSHAQQLPSLSAIERNSSQLNPITSQERPPRFPSLYLLLLLQNFSWSILAGLLSGYLRPPSDVLIRDLRIFDNLPSFCLSLNVDCLAGVIFLRKSLPFFILGLALLLAWVLSRKSWSVRVILLILILFFPIASIVILKSLSVSNPDFVSPILPTLVAIATGIIASLTISSHGWSSKASPFLVTALTSSVGFWLGWFLKFFISQ